MGQTRAQKAARKKPRNAKKQFICKDSEGEELNSEGISTQLSAPHVDKCVEEKVDGCKHRYLAVENGCYYGITKL